MADCENREIYTVNVDSIGFASTTQNDFTTFFNIPLKNVVSAELLSANIPWTTANGPPSSNVIYIWVEQLVSKFNDRTLPGLAENQGTLPPAANPSIDAPISTAAIKVSNTAVLQGSFVRFNAEQTPGNTRTMYESAGNFSSKVNFIDPIRQLDKLHIRILDERGTPLNITAPPSFFTFRFECSKNNICNY
jgi:hypothetical protein